MKKVQVWSGFVWTSFLLICLATNVLPETKDRSKVEERVGAKGYSIQPLKRVQGVIKSEAVKEGIPDIIANAGGIVTLFKIDYSGSPKAVIKAVGDTILPLITTGLSIIPGGTLIAGVVSGIWGALAPFFGGSGKSPMELMIEDLKDEMNRQIEEVRKEMDDKLSSVVHRAIRGAIKRNDYVCNKYAVLSKLFSEDLKDHKPINISLRMEMVADLNDCDDFLKDTAEAFVYPEFADILWVPSAITTLIRVAFLTEVANYGVLLDLDPDIIAMFWLELKRDITRHFKFASQGVQKRLEKVIGKKKKVDKFNFTAAEYEGCRMQAELLYFDRQIYPYGVPKQFQVYSDDLRLNMADFNVTESDEPHHIQAYYNDFDKPRNLGNNVLLNCMMGPARISRVPDTRMFLGVTFVPNKSYQLRLLYFQKNENLGIKDPYSLNGPIEKTSFVAEASGNVITLTAKSGMSHEESAQRFEIPTSYHVMSCDHKGECLSEGIAYSGNYVILNFMAINVETEDNLKGAIFIETKDEMSFQDTDDKLLFGIEIIVLPKMAKTI